jgi:primosomal protein N' (replication factor Y)
MGYPPFSHVFMVMFSGPGEKEIIIALNKLLAIMQYCNKKGRFEMIGPASAFVSKIKNLYRWRILVKNEDEDLLKKFVLYCVGKLKENDPLKDINIFLTMDPVNME